MGSHICVLMSAGVFAVAVVVVGLLALHLHHVKTAVALVMVGGLGLGYLTAIFTLPPRSLPNQAAMSQFDLEADETIRSLQSLPKYDDPKRLTRYESKVFSQGGEDGIIQEIFRRIGTTNKTFCEFGSADGIQNNTALLVTLGWGGLWMDGDPAAIERAKARDTGAVAKGRLQIQRQFITAENIEGLMAGARLPAELDLLSVDIDRNDFYVWDCITSYRPRAVVIEYNPMFPPGVDWVIPYDAAAWWEGTSYFGGSLSAFERLGRKKGYSLVACSLTGANAFFVRDDLVSDKFSSPFTAEHHYEPPRLYLIPYTPGFIRDPR
jgi:hypothetical protein